MPIRSRGWVRNIGNVVRNVVDVVRDDVRNDVRDVVGWAAWGSWRVVAGVPVGDAATR